jgi:hypothetical protein
MTNLLSFGRRHRRREEADAETLYWDQIGDLFGLEQERDPSFLPPLVQIGWMRAGQGAQGDLYCLVCAPGQPTRDHVPVYAPSVFAMERCASCARPLDHHLA